jgi:hypothetical protein
MEGLSPVQYLLSGTAFAVYCYLLYSLAKSGLIRHFPFFYGFVVWCLVRDALRWVVIAQWGYGSEVYYHAYYTSGLLTPLVQILLLVEIYYRVRSRRDFGHWVVLAVFTVMVSAYALYQQQSNFYIAFNTIGLYFQVLFCLLVHIQLQKNRQLYLGRNYSAILYGLSLMIALQSLNYALRLFEYLPHESFRILLQTLGFIPWIGYLIWMRKLDLPGELEEEVVHELAVLEANFRRAAKSMR